MRIVGAGSTETSDNRFAPGREEFHNIALRVNQN
jgi:hypothetical protein